MLGGGGGGGGQLSQKDFLSGKKINIIRIEGWSFAPTAPYLSSRSRMSPVLSHEWSISIPHVLFNAMVGPQISYLGPRVSSSALDISSTRLF